MNAAVNVVTRLRCYCRGVTLKVSCLSGSVPGVALPFLFFHAVCSFFLMFFGSVLFTAEENNLLHYAN